MTDDQIDRGPVKNTQSVLSRRRERHQNGALAKVRAESTGLTSLLYEQELSPLSRLALCSQFDATNLDKP